MAIVTPKAQTTRTRIHGIYDVPAKKGKRQAAQIVFVDTPGVHTPGTLLDKRMMQEVYDALETRDIVVLIVDATRNYRLAAPGEKLRPRRIRANSVNRRRSAKRTSSSFASPASSTARFSCSSTRST